MIEKEPFVRYKLDEEKDKEKRTIITVSYNKEEQERLKEDQKILKQPKDSTAIKTLAEIGSIVIHDQKMRLIIDTLFKNERNNKRSGRSEFD